MKFKEKKRINIFLDPSVAGKARVYAALTGMGISQLVEDLLSQKMSDLENENIKIQSGLDKYLKPSK